MKREFGILAALALLTEAGNAVAADFSATTGHTAPPSVVHGGFEAEFGIRTAG